jgi:hypothetical protein
MPSRSAVHRYGQKLDRSLAAIRASTEAAKLIQAQAGDDQDARSEAVIALQTEAVIALVQTELFESHRQPAGSQAAEDTVDEEGHGSGRPHRRCCPAPAKNIATLARASVNQKKFRLEVQARAEAAAATFGRRDHRPRRAACRRMRWRRSGARFWGADLAESYASGS